MKVDDLAIWATSGTGDDFQCIHLDDARLMESFLTEALDDLKIAANRTRDDSLWQKIEKFLDG